jgi:hypothetical protein
MNNISETIIRGSFHLSVLMIEKFHDMKSYEVQVDKLRNLEEDAIPESTSLF